MLDVRGDSEIPLSGTSEDALADTIDVTTDEVFFHITSCRCRKTSGLTESRCPRV